VLRIKLRKPERGYVDLIITRTPLRVSFVGGGTDLPWFFQEYGGSVISTSINKYVYVSVHDLFEDEKIYLKYSQTELVGNPNELRHPIVKAILSELGLKGIEINVSSDVSGGSGLGSSSSFTVGTLHSLYVYENRILDKKNLAEDACRIEIEILREAIGKQDQFAAAFGGLNHLEFKPNGEVTVDRINFPSEGQKWLNESMYLMRFGRGQRSASEILQKQKEHATGNRETMNILQELSELSRNTVKLIESDPYELGRSLQISWELKMKSNPFGKFEEADTAIKYGLKQGAVGAKALGAGASGFILFLVEDGSQRFFETRMGGYKLYKVSPENQGSVLIYSD
jgi:D-glycero-alpha-D-manno-heptose-7-phosphate kinase